jgi:hypothetical protein
MLNLMVLTVVLTAVGVAASLHNQKKLRLVIENNQLIVEQGKLFPIGFEPIKPDTESKEKAYAPISLRDTMKVDVPIEFSDRTELDQYLFSLLAAWSKELISSGSSGDVSLAETLIERSELIPGVSVQQRREIRAMKADLSFSAAKRLILESKEILRRAEQELLDAGSVESRFEEETRQWQLWLTHVLALFEGGPALPVSSAKPPTPTPPPVQDLPENDSSGLKVKQKDSSENSEKSLPKQENTVQSDPQSFDL